MNDTALERAKRLLAAEGPCRFDVPQNVHFEWMRARCLQWTGGRLKMIPVRTVRARIRILPVEEEQLIVWDYEDLAQHEYLTFLLQFDSDDELNILIRAGLYNFAARILFADGHLIHSGQLARGVQKDLPDKERTRIETCQRQRKPYDSRPFILGTYLLFFHEEAHYIFRKTSLERDRFFRLAEKRIEELREKAEETLGARDFSAIRGPRGGGPFSKSEADGVYPRNLIAFLAKNGASPSFIEEVACDISAIEQLVKVHKPENAPVAAARLYAAVMMHYQIQATLEGIRKVYESIGGPQDDLDAEQNTENQIRNDIRGFYLTEKLAQILNPEPSFWQAYDAEVTSSYKEGLSKRYWRLVVMSAAVEVIAKARDKTWLGDCAAREKALSYEQREGIRKALETDFGF